MHLSLLEQFPLLCLCWFPVCKSLWCLISTPTQGGQGGHLFRLTCSVVVWGGKNTANKYCWCVWEVLAVYGPHWICPSSQQHVLSGSTLLGLQGALQGIVQSGPRSKPLRFILSGTPQGHRLGWACVLCISKVGAAQVTIAL